MVYIYFFIVSMSNNNFVTRIISYVVLICGFVTTTNGADSRFQTYYNPSWGQDHLTVNPQGTEVQLKMDKSSGAGFKSKSDFGSGLFRIRMKIPEKKTGGIVTTFYLYSVPEYGQNPGNHFEVDFEFLGTNGTVQTNVYADDMGHREQSFRLWFDPSKGFHSYEFLWNSYQIVFFIDDIPIRVYKNHKAQGVRFPDKPMHLEATIWNAEWAGPVDWSQAPFIASYQGFGFEACSIDPKARDVSTCASDKYSWNQPKYRELSAAQKQQMQQYRSKYMTYDYCTKQGQTYKECALNKV